MKKIGEGYYYFVYDIGDGKVLKKQKSNFRILMFVLFANRFNLNNTIREYKKAISAIPQIKNVYERIINSGFNQTFLGNPKFLKGISYEQDKVKIVKDFILDLSEKEFTDLIAKYIKLAKAMWKYGLHEEIFNFQLNNGISNDGTFTLIDFNEIIFDKEKILKDIEGRVWLKRASYYFLDNDKKRIYSELMDSEINAKSFNETFNQNG